MSPAYQSVHLPHPIPDLTKPFDVTSPPDTDLWNKPPSTHSFNAPIIYQTTTVGSFQSARVTISAQWKHRYDQGGLVLVANTSEGRKWIKTGIEYENDQTNLSTVATEKWSDWSLLPLPGQSRATFEAEKAKDGSLWVRLIGDDGKVSPLREVTWWADLPKDTELWVGVLVAKPAPRGEKEDLTVHFEDLEIKLS